VKSKIDELCVSMDGKNVSDLIRQETVGMAASKIAAYPKLRAALLQRQKDFAVGSGLVADGRDMGTVVFPDAEHKFFLTASAAERAKRRVQQLQSAGEAEPDYDAIYKDIVERDERDMNRSASPLKPAEDAVLLDSTELGIDEVLKVALDSINSKN
jgi:cytidylate kinase